MKVTKMLAKAFPAHTKTCKANDKAFAGPVREYHIFLPLIDTTKEPRVLLHLN